ncbi:CHASE2 domain-containing protein [Guyparkeria sp. TX1]|uniref:CHASE2 domain-containing protein n=1 Tax=Guyparkeria sp. TX1 TaxID=3115001 RepID=UPI0039772720
MNELREGVKARVGCERLTPATAAKIIVAIGAFYFLVVVDVFNIEAETRKMSQSFTAQVMAPFYPSDQSDVLVILFDNSFLREGGTWPASFTSHAHLVNRLSSLNPESVFYDIIFGKRSGNHDVTPLVSAINRLEQKQIPFYYPKDVNDVAINEIGDVSRQVITQWDNHGVFYPPTHQGMSTPAFEIYRQNVDNQVDLSQWPNMFVYWGAREARNLSGFWEKTSKSWDIFFSQETQPRPYIPSVTYQEFFSTNDREELRQLVSGKHVLVGTSIDGIEDYVTNAVDGQAPGVFLHAMALDNLLKFGTDYFRDGDKIGPSSISGPLLVELGAIVSLIVMWQWVNCSSKTRRSTVTSLQKQRLLLFRDLGIATIASAVVLAIAFWVINGVMRSDPGNVMGILSMDLPAFALAGVFLEIIIAWFALTAQRLRSQK